jgi:hypothetical protein
MENYMTNHLFFYFGFSFIIIHEMDAVRCKEWRIFPGLSFLDDNLGFKVFIIAHIPLFYFLIWGLMGQTDNDGLIRGLDIFFIVHIGFHLLFLLHKKNEFKDLLSWTIISSAGIFGLLDLLLS